MTEQTLSVAPKVTEPNVNWNFWVNVVDIVFFTLGASIVARDTVMPALVSKLTDSKMALGFIPAIFSLGFYLPQLFIANLSEQMRYKKPFVMWIGSLVERLPFLLIALTIWYLGASHPTAALIGFFLLLVTTAMGSGVGMPAWSDMMAKVIPVQRRGLWSGLSHSLGALIGAGGALYFGQMLDRINYPNNFALLFFVAFLMLIVSFIGLALNREPPSTTVKESIPLARYLSQLPDVLRRDANYRRFLLSRTTTQLGTIATGFFMASGLEKFHIDGVTVGRLTAAQVFTVALMNLVWGLIGDRLGHKRVLGTAAFAMTLATLSVRLADTPLALAISFVLVGIYAAADGVSAFNILLEFCAAEDRPTYVGLTNTLLAPVLILGPLLGGWLAGSIGYDNLFLFAAIMATIGGLMMNFWVKEPRFHGKVENSV
ncbi:MAG: MFS transporter [Caldilineaceae bacterium]